MNERLVKSIVLLLLFIAGLAYRLYLGSMVEKVPRFDQWEYNVIAERLTEGQIDAECCTHGPGYSLFLYGIYLLFGRANVVAVYVIQAGIDTLTALMIFFLAQRLISERAGMIGLLLYLFNPFTSSYTGLILTETFGCFLVILIAYLLVRVRQKKSLTAIGFLGFTLGVFAITKYAFFYAMVAVTVAIAIQLFRKRVMKGLIVFLISFVVVFIYPAYANLDNYQTLTVMPPRSDLPTLLYASFYMGRYPELYTGLWTLNRTYTDTMLAYYHVARWDPQHFSEFKQTYRGLLFDKLKTEWPTFFANTVRNIVLMWDKPYRTVYVDPLYPTWKPVFQIVNAGYIGLFIIGFINGFRQHRLRILAVFTAFLFAYVSWGLALLTNETRVTIVLYPLLLLWAGLGASFFLRSISVIVSRSMFRKK